MPPKPPSKPAPKSADIDAVAPEHEGATVLDAGSDTAPEHAGATVVFDTNTSSVKKPGGSAKLVVTKGPKAGSEFPLGPGETSLGRQADNTVVIPDISVSRRHVVLRKQGSGWILVDQGSGNGTQLNGERVQGEAPLSDGDLFCIGDTEIRFSAPAAAAPARKTGAAPAAPARRSAPPARPVAAAPARARPAPRPSLADSEAEMTGRFPPNAAVPSRRGANKQGGGKGKILVAVGLVVVAGLGGLIVVKRQQQQAAEAAAADQAAQEKQQVQDAFNKMVEKGKAKVREGDFKGAVDSFTAAVAAGKASNLDTRDAARRLAVASGEVANQEAADRAKEAADRGELAAAVELLKGIPEDSAYHDRVPQLMADIKAKVPDRLNAGKAALASKDFDAARKAVADVLAVDPDNSDAAALSSAIDAAGAPKPVAKPVSTGSEKADPTEKIMEVARSGRFDEALQAAQACSEPKCKALADKLQSATEACNNPDSADPERTAALLRSLGAASSPCMGAVAGKAVTKYLKQGIGSMGAEEFAKAFQSFRKAKELDPGNPVAEKHLLALRDKAQSLFQQAYVDKGEDPEKARREFELVISITADGDELNLKAHKHLKSLAGP